MYTQPDVCSVEGVLLGFGIVSFLSGVLSLVALQFAAHVITGFGPVSGTGFGSWGFSKCCVATPHCCAALFGWLCPLLGSLDDVTMPAQLSVLWRTTGCRVLPYGWMVGVRTGISLKSNDSSCSVHPFQVFGTTAAAFLLLFLRLGSVGHWAAAATACGMFVETCAIRDLLFLRRAWASWRSRGCVPVSPAC